MFPGTNLVPISILMPPFRRCPHRTQDPHKPLPHFTPRQRPYLSAAASPRSQHPTLRPLSPDSASGKRLVSSTGPKSASKGWACLCRCTHSHTRTYEPLDQFSPEAAPAQKLSVSGRCRGDLILPGHMGLQVLVPGAAPGWRSEESKAPCLGLSPPTPFTLDS